MNRSKRAFLGVFPALLAAAVSLTPYAALGGTVQRLSINITARIGRDETRDRFSLNREQLSTLSGLSGGRRGAFLSDIILRRLAHLLPDIPWPQVRRDIGREIDRQTDQLYANGAGENMVREEAIKVAFRWKGPGDWQIRIEC